MSSGVIKTRMNSVAGSGAAVAGPVAEARDPNRPAEIPNELGLYAKVEGNVTHLEPEVVTWKVRGKLMGAVSRELAAGHQNGVVRGRNSRYQASMPLDLFIAAPEGTSANEHQCVSMQQKDKHRKFRIMTADMVKAGMVGRHIRLLRCREGRFAPVPDRGDAAGTQRVRVRSFGPGIAVERRLGRKDLQLRSGVRVESRVRDPRSSQTSEIVQ